MVFGTFDLLHQGHINMFSQAKKHGDYLIAVVARDATVKGLKKRDTVEDEKTRRKNVSRYTDKAVLGNKKDKFAVLRKYRPDVICLGYDQTFFTDMLRFELKKLSLKTKVVRLEAFKPEVYKSSLLRDN